MPKLRNRAGVVVSVSDAMATRLGPGWTPVKGDIDKAGGKSKPARRAHKEG